ncbi:MAG: hypothetical protein AMXMBFR36_07950 [Acidobacteriota bacterium]
MTRVGGFRTCRPLASLLLGGITLVGAGSFRSASGQVLPYGPEFQVNTYTTSNQLAPRVVAQPGGGFAIVWCCGSSGGGAAVVARRFDASGLPLAGEATVSEQVPQHPTGLAGDGAGNLVAIWGRGVPGPGGGNPANVKARRLDAALVPLGSQFVVNEGGPGEYLSGGRVASQPGGEFVVVWEDYGGWARAFDDAGAPLGPSFVIPGSTGQSSYPSIAPLPAGEFLVAWREVPGPGGTQLRARRYDSEGDPVGDDISIAEGSEAPSDVRVATHSSGSFVAAWRSWAGGEEHVRARRFAADGSSLGNPFQVDSGNADSRYVDGVAIESDGAFVVTWSEISYDDNLSWEVSVRRYAADGIALGAPFRLNSYTTSSQDGAELAVLESGDLLVTWSSFGSTGDDDLGSSVQARRFQVPFFMDGFESGDTWRWSNAGTR